MKVIYLAGGCFWGTQHYFDLLNGVVETEVGYANGNTKDPSYEDVRYKGTGHAETVKVVYDESVITLTELMEIYFKAIDPVSVNKQGEDEGEQYRTGIYYEDIADAAIIKQSLDGLQERYDEPVAVELGLLENYYTAEEYHQKYLEKNPTGYCHIPLELFDAVKEFNRE